MASVEQQVRSADSVICRNIATGAEDRGFLSQNVLGQLRNLVEGLMVWVHLGDGTATFHFDQVGPASDFVRPRAKLRLLSRFHGLLQASASHYTLERDPSERLMLKYYEFLLRTRDLAQTELGISILGNLGDFPVDLDPSLRDYYEKIAARIEAARMTTAADPRRERYYLHSSRPFFVDGSIYYELTFSLAQGRTSKFDRLIGFTDIDVADKYAAQLELARDTIEVLGRTMPVLLIRAWDVSIRPCEFNNFSSLFAPVSDDVRSSHAEYRRLMRYLTETRSTLLDLVDLPDAAYQRIRAWALSTSSRTSLIFTVLDQARSRIRSNAAGSRLLRYLMLRMTNEVIKAQRDPLPNGWMSNLRVTSSSRPFDTMPFCTSPRGHNPRFADLAECFDAHSHSHELLARRVKNNVEQLGRIYTPEAELEHLGDIDALIARHNRALPPTLRHAPRKLVHDMGHVFITGYEDDTVAIVEKLQAIASDGVSDHRPDAEEWLDRNPDTIDDPLKADALKALFERSKVAVVYGAAGTGKSTMINHIAQYFSDERKLFLAHTHPAVENLRRRVDAPNSWFSTIKSHTLRSDSSHYGVLVVDECSTVGNKAFLEVLENTSFDLLVLVGDVYQIESIEFGNWFGAIRSYIPQESVFELTRPFRTTDQALITLWDRVRKLDDRIEESLAQNGYSAVLGDSLFQQDSDDEIVLCLNYDGLYGINNVNRFLQAGNPNPSVSWGESAFKVGDPVLFNEVDRFRPVIFNNLKGRIVQIDRVPGRVTFDVDLDCDVGPEDVLGTGLRWIRGSTVQFDVFERLDTDTDDDDDTVGTIIPFQIAYAVSIHKAQGLEYDSVKVVITDANEERISHSIFYTAITRARAHLKVFWTPETQERILCRLAVREDMKDENLLRARRGLAPCTARPRRQASRQRP